jgi:formylglycine-generating enzyme required for sulfatase activity
MNRGGGWNNDDPTLVSAALRSGNVPSYRSDSIGFRCARTP